jgi:hypothetical protein
MKRQAHFDNEALFMSTLFLSSLRTKEAHHSAMRDVRRAIAPLNIAAAAKPINCNPPSPVWCR